MFVSSVFVVFLMLGRIPGIFSRKKSKELNLFFLAMNMEVSMPTGSLWDELKDDYIKANPDSKSMDNNNSTLKMPPKDYILPLPKPKDD